MLTTPTHTMHGDERGEKALHHLPGPSAGGEWLIVRAKSLHLTDAWTATTLKTTTEYHSSVGNTLTFEPPEGEGGELAKNRFADLLGQMPEGFNVARESTFGGTHRGGVIFPAMALSNEMEAENAADTVYLRAEAYGKQVAATAGKAFAIFADNSLTHGRNSSIGVVVTVAFEPTSRTVRVVSSDIASELVEPDEAESFLRGMRQATIAAHSSLADLVTLSNKGVNAAVLTLATSSGRLRWGDRWVASETTFFAPGFTAALAIQV